MHLHLFARSPSLPLEVTVCCYRSLGIARDVVLPAHQCHSAPRRGPTRDGFSTPSAKARSPVDVRPPRDLLESGLELAQRQANTSFEVFRRVMMLSPGHPVYAGWISRGVGSAFSRR